MSLRVNVQGGTGAGTRPPFSERHGPKCQCTRCEIDRMTRDLADEYDRHGQPEMAKNHGVATFDPSQVQRVIDDHGGVRLEDV